MIEAETTQAIIQGGAVGIAVLLILYSAWKDRIYNKTLNNHLSHISDALNNIAKVMGSGNEITRRVTKTLDRVDRKLDNL